MIPYELQEDIEVSVYLPHLGVVRVVPFPPRGLFIHRMPFKAILRGVREPVSFSVIDFLSEALPAL